MSDGGLAARIAGSVGALDRASWNALAGDNPFVSHEFLTALEDSGSVGEGTGWQPAPVVIEDAASGALEASCAGVRRVSGRLTSGKP